MQLGGQQPSGNVEDRRGIGVGGGLGIGGVVIALVAYFLGFDPSTVINVAEQVSTQRADTREAPKGAPADEMGPVILEGSGQHGNCLGQSICAIEQQVSTPDTGALRRAGSVGLRDGTSRHGAVLLPE